MFYKIKKNYHNFFLNCEKMVSKKSTIYQFVYRIIVLILVVFTTTTKLFLAVNFVKNILHNKKKDDFLNHYLILYVEFSTKLIIIIFRILKHTVFYFWILNDLKSKYLYFANNEWIIVLWNLVYFSILNFKKFG